jgi:hypothetical protein
VVRRWDATMGPAIATAAATATAKEQAAAAQDDAPREKVNCAQENRRLHRTYVHARGRDGCSPAGDRYAMDSASLTARQRKLEAGLLATVLTARFCPPLPRRRRLPGPSAPAKESPGGPERRGPGVKAATPMGAADVRRRRFNRRVYSHSHAAAATARRAALIHRLAPLCIPTPAHPRHSPRGLGAVPIRPMLFSA